MQKFAPLSFPQTGEGHIFAAIIIWFRQSMHILIVAWGETPGEWQHVWHCGVHRGRALSRAPYLARNLVHSFINILWFMFVKTQRGIMALTSCENRGGLNLVFHLESYDIICSPTPPQTQSVHPCNRWESASAHPFIHSFLLQESRPRNSAGERTRERRLQVSSLIVSFFTPSCQRVSNGSH